MGFIGGTGFFLEGDGPEGGAVVRASKGDTKSNMDLRGGEGGTCG